MISGLFFGFAFGMGGIGAAVLGQLADGIFDEEEVAALGERVDLQIDVLPADTADTERFTVVCEVKGCWNGDVKTALREQLAERYMADVRTQYGVYVVIWADPDDDWDVDDPRRTATVQLGGRQAVSDTLAHIAEQVSQPGREISVVVLDISRGRKGLARKTVT